MILIDGRALQSRSAVRGIGTYLRGLLDGFQELGAASDISLLLARGHPDPPEMARLSISAGAARIPSLHPTLQPVLDPLFIARALRRIEPRLYHGVEWGQPIHSGAPVVMTVHDLIPFIFPRHYPWVRRAHIVALRLLRRADRIIAVSRSTADDLQRVAKVRDSQIVVVPEGISSTFQPAPAAVVEAACRRFGLTKPYVLAVGTFDPRKRIGNLARVVRLLASVHDVELVITGDQGNFGPGVTAALASEQIAHRSHVLGHVDAADLVALYSGARCLLFTSAYEGFGLPPLEAMGCGTAVVMYRNSSLPEVAGSAAVLVTDGDAQALADAAGGLLEDSAERSHRITSGLAWAARFTWKLAAERTLEVYRDAEQHRSTNNSG